MGTSTKSFLTLSLFTLMFWNLNACSKASLNGDQAVAVSADDSALQYFGRIDASNPASPAIIWQGSSVTLSYQGQIESIEFDQVNGSAFFDIAIDAERVGMIQAKTGKVAVPTKKALSETKAHTITITKRSEASAGYAHLKQINLLGKLAPVQSEQQKLDMLFFGDSITAGACNEDGEADQWDDFSTHNSLKSYAALTAEHFDAGYQNISVSGIGIATGYQTEITAPDIWDAYYPKPDSPKADLKADSPQIIFLNYGENDDSYSKKHGQAFPAEFTQRYLNLLNAIRQQFPKSAIVILRGGMSGGANSPRLRQPLEDVVTQFTEQDKNAYHFAFDHWSALHPRVSDHQTMANELISWINKKGLYQPN